MCNMVQQLKATHDVNFYQNQLSLLCGQLAVFPGGCLVLPLPLLVSPIGRCLLSLWVQQHATGKYSCYLRVFHVRDHLERKPLSFDNKMRGFFRIGAPEELKSKYRTNLIEEYLDDCMCMTNTKALFTLHLSDLLAIGAEKAPSANRMYLQAPFHWSDPRRVSFQLPSGHCVISYRGTQ